MSRTLLQKFLCVVSFGFYELHLMCAETKQMLADHIKHMEELAAPKPTAVVEAPTGPTGTTQ